MRPHPIPLTLYPSLAEAYIPLSLSLSEIPPPPAHSPCPTSTGASAAYSRAGVPPRGAAAGISLVCRIWSSWCNHRSRCVRSPYQSGNLGSFSGKCTAVVGIFYKGTTTLAMVSWKFLSASFWEIVVAVAAAWASRCCLGFTVMLGHGPWGSEHHKHAHKKCARHWL